MVWVLSLLTQLQGGLGGPGCDDRDSTEVPGTSHRHRSKNPHYFADAIRGGEGGPGCDDGDTVFCAAPQGEVSCATPEVPGTSVQHRSKNPHYSVGMVSSSDYSYGGGAGSSSDILAAVSSKRRRLLPRPGCQTYLSRAHKDSRRLLMCCCPRWEERRTWEAEAYRFFRNGSAAAAISRRRSTGGFAAGERPWYFMFDTMYTDVESDWWMACDFSYASFLACARDFLAHCKHRSAFDYFVLRGVHTQEEYEEGVEEAMARPVSEAQAEKLSKRLAALNERASVWDTCEPGIGLEMCGDSLLVCNWLAGVWKVGGGDRGEGLRYQVRVDRFISRLESLAQHGLRPSSLGRDFTRHVYREGNEWADRLTHLARDGHCFRELYPDTAFPSFDRDLFEIVGLRGNFDGGVDGSGVGIGWWLQIGLLPRYFYSPYPEHVSMRERLAVLYPQLSSSSPILWKTVGECAASLPAHSTITDAELSAVEGLLEAAEGVLLHFNPQWLDGDSLSGDLLVAGSEEPGTPAQGKKRRGDREGCGWRPRSCERRRCRGVRCPTSR